MADAMSRWLVTVTFDVGRGEDGIHDATVQVQARSVTEAHTLALALLETVWHGDHAWAVGAVSRVSAFRVS